MAGKAKIGAGIALDGEKEFKSAISGINKDLTVLKSALEKNKSEFEANGKSTELLNNKLKILSNQYDTQKSKVEALKSALEHAQKNYAKYGTDVEKLKNSLSEAEKAMEEMKKSSSTTKEELSEQEKKIASIKDELKRAERGYNSAENAIKDWQSSINRTETDLNKTKKAINDTEKELEEFTVDAKKAGKAAKEAGEKAEKSSHDWGKLTSKVGGGITKFAKVTAVIGGALGALGGLGIKVGAEFEAGMSEVQAISQATAEEMEKLTDKAKQMGAETKFSASESAEAFKYMAQAGWEPQEMLDGIAGVMSLAAASGEELALTSDIVTDSLTAFGLQAKDASHFADVLAITATKSNTNVAALGETFKYVAPVAGALQYSVEDVGVAIGLMANRSIKGEQAGTALRTMLTNLAKPTNQMAGYMQQLNLSITDTQGNVKPFNQLLVEMRDSFSGLTEAQKAEYAAGIAGKEAMSGLLAIVNASDEEFNSLTEQINNCAGAADRTAKIMQDNLKGSVEQLGGACETLGIAFYESVNNPLKDITQTATGMVEQLTKAFEKDGLSGLISEFGSVFSDMVTKAAENAPKMIDVALDMVISFTKGIGDNADKIGKSAADMVKTLASGLVQATPEIAGAAIDIVSAFVGSLFGSGFGESLRSFGDFVVSFFKTIVETVKNVFNSLKPTIEAFGNVIDWISKTIFPVLSKSVEILAKMVEKLLPLITGLGTAFGTLKVVDKISGKISNFTKKIKDSEGSIKNLLKEIKSVDKAKKALSSLFDVNPITKFSALVAGAGAAIFTLGNFMANLDTEQNRMIKRINEENEAREEAIGVVKKQLEENDREINSITVLKSELDSLIDANGRVKEGYEDRVNFISNELTEKTGVEISITDGVVSKYDELSNKLDEVIIKKRAVSSVETLEEVRKNAQAAIDADNEQVRVAQENYDKQKAINDNKIKSGQQVTLGEQSALERYENILEESKKIRDKHANDIALISNLERAVESGNVDDIKRARAELSKFYNESGEEINKTVEQQLKEKQTTIDDFAEKEKNSITDAEKEKWRIQKEASQKELDLLKGNLVDRITLIDENGEPYEIAFNTLMERGAEGIKNGEVPISLATEGNMSAIVTAITNSQLPVEEQTKLLADLQTKIFKDNAPNVGAAEQSTMQSVLDAIGSTNPQMASAVQALVNAGIIELDNGKIGFSDKAGELGLDGNEALKEYIDDFNTTAKSIVEGAESGVTKYAYKFTDAIGMMASNAKEIFQYALKVNSPSKVFRDIAKSIPEGAALGVKNNAKIALLAVSDMAKNMTLEYERSIGDFSTNTFTDNIGHVQAGLNRVNNLDKTLKLSVDIPKSVNTQTVPSTQISPTFVIQIDKFVNNRPGDVQSFAQELDFYARNANLARGLT